MKQKLDMFLSDKKKVKALTYSSVLFIVLIIFFASLIKTFASDSIHVEFTYKDGNISYSPSYDWTVPDKPKNTNYCWITTQGDRGGYQATYYYLGYFDSNYNVTLLESNPNSTSTNFYSVGSFSWDRNDIIIESINPSYPFVSGPSNISYNSMGAQALRNALNSSHTRSDFVGLGLTGISPYDDETNQFNSEMYFMSTYKCYGSIPNSSETNTRFSHIFQIVYNNTLKYNDLAKYNYCIYIKYGDTFYKTYSVPLNSIKSNPVVRNPEDYTTYVSLGDDYFYFDEAFMTITSGAYTLDQLSHFGSFDIYTRLEYQLSESTVLYNNYTKFTLFPFSDNVSNPSGFDYQGDLGLIDVQTGGYSDGLTGGSSFGDIIGGTGGRGNVYTVYDTYGDFNLNSFISQGGGVQSVLSSVQIVFSWFPNFLWTMFYYCLSAIITIGLAWLVFRALLN